MIRRILVVTSAFLGALAGIFAVFGLVLAVGWPWWVGVFLLFVLAGVAAAGVAVRQIVVRRREERFVSQIVAQDEAALRTLEESERKRHGELADKFRQAVDSLRKSHLRKIGNPLYVLPWYMVIGESGSGKTTAIKSARLASPFAEMTQVPGVSGTKNCDWWFFENAVIIDTAGRYAIPVDAGRDRDEWQRFLGLLARYRRREPLNGLVVTVSADSLVGSEQAIEENGREIRRRIDELMRALGRRFPVYVLVTKCDLIQGMTDLCGRLDEKTLDQAFGVAKEDLDEDCGPFVARAMETLTERLRRIRLVLLPKASGMDPSLLLFPEEFSKLARGLEAFTQGAFQKNPYQETPMFRGIYFSSGRQEGTPYSHFLNALGLIGSAEVLPGTSKGLFLHDFFARILPGDRHLSAPTRRALAWERLTARVVLTAWIAFMVGICGLLSFAFVKNITAIRSIPPQVAGTVRLSGDTESDLQQLMVLRAAVENLHKKNSAWWIPRFGLNASVEVERRLMDRYCSLFTKRMLSPYDARLRAALGSMDASDERIGDAIITILGRIRLIRSRLDTGEVGEAPRVPLAVPWLIGPSEQDVQHFTSLYLDRLRWEKEDDLAKEAENLSTLLADAVKRSSSLGWIVRWVDAGLAAKEVTLREFWGGSREAATDIRVAPAYTREGRAMVKEILADLEAAIGGDAAFAANKSSFVAGYNQASFDAWRSFIAGFARGSERLAGEAEWSECASRIASGRGPSHSLEKRVAEEIASLGEGGMPEWARAFAVYERHRGLASTLGAGGAVTKATQAASRLKEKLQETIGAPGQAESLDRDVVCAQALKAYETSLSKAAAMVSASRAKACQAAAVTFGDDPQASPFMAASSALDRYETSSGMHREVMILVRAPLDFLWEFARQEAACQLQQAWEKDVLADAQGIADPMQLNQVLFAPDGLATKFIKETAAPFLNRDARRGFYPKVALGASIPFEEAFLGFISRAKVGLSVAALAQAASDTQVTVTGLPTEANDNARVQPHATRLVIQCMDGQQVLVNMNFPVTKTLVWSGIRCGGVTFSIEVGNLVLTKTYTGPDAFAKFLMEFQGGTRTFTPADFPREASHLTSLGIRYIKVQYRFSGHQAVIAQARPVMDQPKALPATIVRCRLR